MYRAGHLNAGRKVIFGGPCMREEEKNIRLEYWSNSRRKWYNIYFLRASASIYSFISPNPLVLIRAEVSSGEHSSAWPSRLQPCFYFPTFTKK
jgi:hypothetical protein